MSTKSKNSGRVVGVPFQSHLCSLLSGQLEGLGLTHEVRVRVGTTKTHGAARLDVQLVEKKVAPVEMMAVVPFTAYWNLSCRFLGQHLRELRFA